jgi:paraquat-inducible protein A
MTGIDVAHLKACHCCGLVQELPHVPEGSRARCARCGSGIIRPGRRATSNRRAVAAALAALILYPFAISMPIMRLERFGNYKDASIWTGSVGMLEKGELFVGTVVLLCSVIIPLFKLFGLLSITLGRRQLTKRHRAFTYRVIEWTGRWGMLDVLLIAVVVAWIKIGDLVEVSAGPVALAFTACVLMSLLASAWFDPHALWEEST